MSKGQPSLMLAAIATAQQAIAADPELLPAYCRKLSIDALDYRTLTQCGLTRVMRGEQERAIADSRRALHVNPNSAVTLVLLAWAEATAGWARRPRRTPL